jgi:hypothetical protein
MRAECKTKNEVFGFAYAECSRTYEKLSKRKQKDSDRTGVIYV